MILRLDSDDGIIKIGSPPEAIPGIVESVKINDALLMDNKEVQGRSGKAKEVQGWDDITLQISLSLIDNPGANQTRWDCLKQITDIFKKVADDGKPEIYTVSHPMVSAWGTKKMVFLSLESSEDRTRRKISASLEFVEYDPTPGVIQDRKGTAAEPDQADIAAAQERMLVSDSQRGGLGKLEERFAD